MATLTQVVKGLSFREWVLLFGSLEDPSIRERGPFNPWAGQLDLLEWVEGKTEVWVPKARQLGISEVGAERIHKGLIEIPGSQYVVISKNADDAEYFLQERLVKKVEYMIENAPEGIVWPTIKKKNMDLLVLSNGSTVMSLPAVSASGASRTLNGFILDEFGGVDGQPHCKGDQLYKNISPTIEKSKGWAWIIGTSEPGSFFNTQLWKQWKGETKSLYYFLSWMTDPSRTEEWYKESISKVKTEADFKNQYPRNMSEFFATREGRVFPSFDHEPNGKHIRYFEPNWELQYFTAYDHGFKHYAATLHALYDPYNDMLFIIGEQFWRGVGVEQIARDIKEREKQYNRIPIQRLADVQIFNEDGRKSVADHFKAEGLAFKPAWKADEAGSRGLLGDRFVKNRILIHPDCKDTITQLMNYVWKKSDTGEKPQDKDDEAPDCLRWLCAMLHKKDRPEEIKKVGGRTEYASARRKRLFSEDNDKPRHWMAV